MRFNRGTIAMIASTIAMIQRHHRLPLATASFLCQPITYAPFQTKTLSRIISYSTISTRLHSTSKSQQQEQQQQQSTVKLRYTEFPLPPSPPTTLPSSTTHSTTITLHHHLHEPVILLHGLLGNRRNFASLGAALSKRLQKRRQIFAVDLRNHGSTKKDELWHDEMDYPAMARDVLALLDDLGIERGVLVGHSMGGKVAKALALLHPDRVAGLVVLDIAPVVYREEDGSGWGVVKDIVNHMDGLTLTGGMTKRDVDKELRRTVEDPALRAFLLTNLDTPRRSRGEGKTGGDDGGDDVLQWKVNINAIARQLHVIAGFDLGVKKRLRYEGDTFIINGGASRFVRHGHMQRIAELFPNHMLTTVRGAGHWVHAEAPDDTLALLTKYLDR